MRPRSHWITEFLDCINISGFVFATLFSNHATFVHASVGCFFPVFTLSGIFWPLEGMPELLKWVAFYLPNTSSVQAMRDIMTKEKASIEESIGITSIWIFALTLVTIIAIKLKSPN